MNIHQLRSEYISRRHFLRDCGVGLGKIALASLLAGTAKAAPGPHDSLYLFDDFIALMKEAKR